MAGWYSGANDKWCQSLCRWYGQTWFVWEKTRRQHINTNNSTISTAKAIASYQQLTFKRKMALQRKEVKQSVWFLGLYLHIVDFIPTPRKNWLVYPSYNGLMAMVLQFPHMQYSRIKSNCWDTTTKWNQGQTFKDSASNHQKRNPKLCICDQIKFGMHLVTKW